MNLWTLFVVVVLFGGVLLVAQRNRKRLAVQQSSAVAALEVGSEVMTTSGLYGTVVARNDDDTVLLAIAPGVEVKWAVAALRTADALPSRYRQGIAGPAEDREDPDEPAAGAAG